jgi:hypothetical protein
MSDWKVIGNSGSSISHVLTLGLAPDERYWTVKNKETDEVRRVIAYSEEGAIEKADEGDFVDGEDDDKDTDEEDAED